MKTVIGQFEDLYFDRNTDEDKYNVLIDGKVDFTSSSYKGALNFYRKLV